jgi:dTDP-4-dehydrorhamnose reductase
MRSEAADVNRRLELWGGIECTVNRVGGDYHDQLQKNGHAERIHDLDRFAQLGITAIRYPLLWERIAPDEEGPGDWQWARERLERLRALGIEPIVGLLHHGSGPRHSSLLDEQFPEKLARYAREVAQRFPWVTHYTPVNEPLTTARFSGLYGHWYPHGTTDTEFVRTLLNQCRGIVLAMRTIREVQPAAELVQTENLEQIHSTRLLRYQADFENERRWLSIDLLTGRVDRGHYLWKYLRASGADAAELDWFRDQTLSPCILGWNYYLTSERFLDQRVRRYPLHYHGGNGRHRYADVEAVRVRGEGIVGLKGLLRQAWERYDLPMAVTEVHLGCHRELQLRWLLDAWSTGKALRHEGVDLRAITAWSLLGAYDWNTLCTQNRGHYESGVFDLRRGTPRPTALAKLMQELAAGKQPSHPALPARGWWEEPGRLLYPRVYTTRRQSEPAPPKAVECPPLLIVSDGGTLGRTLARACEERNWSFRLHVEGEPDAVQRIAAIVAQHRAWAVIYAAGDGVSNNAADIGFAFPDSLSEACGDRGLPLMCLSADAAPSDDGRSYLVVIRVNRAATQDASATPAIEVPDLAHACLDLLVDGESGFWHFCSPAPQGAAQLDVASAVEESNVGAHVPKSARSERAGEC